MKRLATLIVGVVLALSLASTAMADSSTCQAYNNCQSTTTTATATNSTNAVTTTTLPFTGLDVGLLLAGGAGLLGAGLLVRRLSAGSR